MIFISYSSEEEETRQQFERVCSPALKKYGTAFWSDAQMKPGEWEKQIEASMNDAEAAVFLVSNAFLNSRIIMDKEVAFFLKAHAQRQVPVVWVLLETCMVHRTPIIKFQAVKVGSKLKPLFDQTESQKLKTLVKAGDMICDAMDDLERPVFAPTVGKNPVTDFERRMAVLAKPCKRDVEVLIRPANNIWYRQQPIPMGETSGDMSFGNPKYTKADERLTMIALTTDHPLENNSKWDELPPYRTASKQVTVVRK